LVEVLQRALIPSGRGRAVGVRPGDRVPVPRPLKGRTGGRDRSDRVRDGLGTGWDARDEVAIGGLAIGPDGVLVVSPRGLARIDVALGDEDLQRRVDGLGTSADG